MCVHSHDDSAAAASELQPSSDSLTMPYVAVGPCTKTMPFPSMVFFQVLDTSVGPGRRPPVLFGRA